MRIARNWLAVLVLFGTLATAFFAYQTLRRRVEVNWRHHVDGP